MAKKEQEVRVEDRVMKGDQMDNLKDTRGIAGLSSNSPTKQYQHQVIISFER